MSRPVRRVLLAAALVVQLAILYWPRVPGPPGLLDVPGLDKLVHLATFASVAWTGVRAGCGARWWLPLLAVHAVVSEVLQAAVLPHRSGDGWDVVADLAGVCLGALLVRRGSAQASWTRDRARAGDDPGRPTAGGHAGTG